MEFKFIEMSILVEMGGFRELFIVVSCSGSEWKVYIYTM